MKEEYIKEIAKISLDEFEAIKREAVKLVVIERLENIIKNLKEEKLEKVEEYIATSDNGGYIYFSDITSFEDIDEVVDYLTSIKSLKEIKDGV